MSIGPEIKALIRVYERNGKDCDPWKERISVQSHWNAGDKVVVRIGTEEYTVFAHHLIEAIKRASR